MSLSAGFSSAWSGLVATSRLAEVLSSNVANATTPGYARRGLLLSSAGSGQGVRVTGVTRDVGLSLLNDRRAAQAATAGEAARAAFLQQMEKSFGESGTSGSLLSRIDALDTALLDAAARPESEAALTAAVDAAGALAQGLNDASAKVQAQRLEADRSIAKAVEDLNTALRQVEDLNGQIVAASASGRDASALMDQRAAIVDGIAALVPLREVTQDNGRISLVTTGGAVLLDGRAAEFGFTPVQVMTAGMSVENGALSGVTLNGKPMATTGAAALLGGGELAAMFTLRDDLAVTGQTQLDALARDLVERFAPEGMDATLPAGSPGLFTDAGGAFESEAGLATRIALNAAVDPAKGGSVLRLRDGLGSTTPGAEGDASLLAALSERMSAVLETGSPAVAPGSRSLSGLASDLLSLISTGRVSAESELSFASARLTTLTDAEQAAGVDVDAEMQALLVLEKNYAANAKVIQALDGMLGTLLEI